MLKSVELFAGAGGLALGTALAGFHAVAAAEWDRWACNTLENNRDRGHPLLEGLHVFRGDVRQIDFSDYTGKIDLLTGGPPCQPFSIGGKHRAHEDHRDMFPAFAKVLAAVRPRAFIIENVRGLRRASFENYLSYVLNSMRSPETGRKLDETWEEHSERLVRRMTSTEKPTYKVQEHVFNAVNFGAPQKRERIFIVGFLEDEDAQWSWPLATHSEDEMIRSQWVTGEYWDKHLVPRGFRGTMPDRLRRRVDELRSINLPPEHHPWRTVRDALVGLDEPVPNGLCRGAMNHRLQPGARTYPGHTGSPLDLPAKALKAGDHGVPGGENMVVLPDGTVRYFSVREAARLQTFPDSYVFDGAWSEAMRQIGNAVPVVLAQAVASSVAESLSEAEARSRAENLRRRGQLIQ